MGCGSSSRLVDQKPCSMDVTAFVGNQNKPEASRLSSKANICGSDRSYTAFVKVWPSKPDGTLCFPECDDPDFAIPALETDKLPLAVCMSGGGFRAATLALGWLRALHTLGVLQKAKYLSACSGSSWISSALCFQRLVSTDEFLGLYLPPEQCTLETLKDMRQQGSSAAAVLANAEPLREYIKDMAGVMVDRHKVTAMQAASWSKAIAAAFLVPHGLGNTDSSTVTCTGSKGAVEVSVKQRAAALHRDNVYTASLDELPYLIIAQVITLPRERVKYYPVEWTPLYSGCPVKSSETCPKLGAGWVEVLGLNADLVGKPEPTTSASGAVHVRVRAMGPASLGEAIGISSAYNACTWALGKTEATKKLHRALGFNTAQYFDMQDWSSNQVEMADGGGIDYFALFPALRRRVPAVIVCSATRTRMDDPKFAFYMKELAGLFGCWPGESHRVKEDGEMTAEEWNTSQQVFASEGFPALCEALRAAVAAGGPPVCVADYEVLSNSALGLHGGWMVRVMWVVNDQQLGWEAALPGDMRQQLERDRTGLRAAMEEALNPLDADTLREFPHVSTFAMNYTPLLVGLMANHAAHMIMSSGEALGQLMKVAAAGKEMEVTPQQCGGKVA